MSIDTPEIAKPVLEFKSANLNIPVLVLHDANLAQIEHQLDEKISQAPEFFKHSPILIDLQILNDTQQAFDLQLLVKLLRNKLFMPIGIRGGNASQNQQALALDIPLHTARQSAPPANSTAKEKPLSPTTPEQPEKAAVENIFINTPIRSGQRIYAHGDLIIAATVSAGAEIMAEGNIHVYGTLRGRALAGVQGDTNSRIFCSNLQAELISIAGNYKISDELDPSLLQQPVQIFLQKQALMIEPI